MTAVCSLLLAVSPDPTPTSFITWRAAPYGLQGSAVAAGDLDEDGLDDLLVFDAGRIILLRAQPDRTFSAPMLDRRAGSVSYKVIVQDFNNDDHLDVAAGYVDGSLWLFLGDGNGDLSAGAPQSLNGPIVDLASCDLDTDGDPDLVALLPGGSVAGVVQAVLNSGAGVLSPASTHPVTALPVRLACGDFDGDGRGDAAVSSDVLRAVTVVFGDGNGGFENPTGLTPVSDFLTPLAVAAGDLSGDDIDDLVVSNGGIPLFGRSQQYGVGFGDQSTAFPYDPLGSGSLFVSNGDRTFADAQYLELRNAPRDVRIADIDGDGAPDIVSVGLSGILLLLQRSETFRRVRFGAFTAGLMTLGDFDGDSILDIAALDGSPRALVFHGLGGGRFPETTTLVTQRLVAGSLPGGTAAGDFDGDGIRDLVVSTGLPLRLATFRGIGDGAFGPATLSLVPNLVDNIRAANFDRDAADELLAPTAFTPLRPLVLYDLDDNGDYVPREPFGTDGDYSRSVIADFDRDGDLDVAAIGIILPSFIGIDAFLNDGDGNFALKSRLETGKPSTHIILQGDMNGDLFPDLVMLNSGVDQSSFLNRGDGSFGAEIAWPTPLRACGITGGAMADFDSDGKADLALSASCSARQNGVYLLRSDGSGRFGQVTLVSPALRRDGYDGTFLGPLLAADFNNDGFSDLGVGASFGVSIFEGNGAGQFRPFSTAFAISRAEQEGKVIVADLNGDGLLDMAADEHGSERLFVDIAFNDTPPASTIPGDSDCDQNLTPADFVALIRSIYNPLHRPACKGADANGDRAISAADVAGLSVAYSTSERRHPLR